MTFCHCFIYVCVWLQSLDVVCVWQADMMQLSHDCHVTIMRYKCCVAAVLHRYYSQGHSGLYQKDATRHGSVQSTRDSDQTNGGLNATVETANTGVWWAGCRCGGSGGTSVWWEGCRCGGSGGNSVWWEWWY